MSMGLGVIDGDVRVVGRIYDCAAAWPTLEREQTLDKGVASEEDKEFGECVFLTDKDSLSRSLWGQVNV